MFTHLSLPDRVRSTLLTAATSKYLVVLLFVGVMLAGTASVTLSAPRSQAIPTIDIVSVDKDDSVTIRTHNFPANHAFTVTMGPYGTLGLNGTVVATTDSGAGGSFDATYHIPEALYGANRIAIRLQSLDGYNAYNWFYNNTSGTGTGDSGTGGGTQSPTGYWQIPTFSITSVAADESVTIQTRNFPANRDFVVTMGAYGTRGVNGTVAETINSGEGGSFEATFPIPDALDGSYRIAIRMSSQTGGYYAYNWFYNNTTGAGTGDGGTGGGQQPPGSVARIPTFSIVSVERNESVTVQTNNFPANRDFVVTMGAYGTRGINGTVVETINSGEGGSFQATLPIPDGLDNSYRIAIRMTGQTGGFYAYNWFFNNTAP